MTLASYFGNPAGLLQYLDYMVWLEKRHPELIKINQEHPDPDMEYESYRDSVDDDFRGAAEAQGMPEDKIDEALENLSEEEKVDYAHNWDVANNMWK